MSLWLDMDGVVCDSNDCWFNWIRKNYYTSLTLEQMDTWTFVADKYGKEAMEWWKIPGIYTNEVKPFPGVIDFVNEYRKRYGRSVNFITSTYPGMVEEKTEWLEETFGIENIGDIIHDWEKHKWMNEYDILIEDNKENAWNHVVKNHGRAIQFNFQEKHPYAKFCPEITSHCNIFYATSYKRILEILEWVNPIR